jgi:hypothetical protein
VKPRRRDGERSRRSTESGRKLIVVSIVGLAGSLRLTRGFTYRRNNVRAHPDELTVESWPKEPKLSHLSGPPIEDVENVLEGDSPALWKDVALAVLIAVLLWLVVAGVVG